MKDYNEISIHIEDYVAKIEIHRPPNNFFDFVLIGEIADAFHELDELDECRCIILCSEGKHFCAGANFYGEKNLQNDIDPISKLYKEAVRLFRNKKPVIAAIQGGAIGGGLGVALAADFRIGCSEARFSANFSRLAFHQGFGTTITLPRVVGQQNAALMLLTGRRIKGEEALKMGLIDYLVPLEDLREKTIEIAKEICSAGPLGVEAIRFTIREGLADSIEKVIKWELSEQKRLQLTKDFKEGISASSERREPIFTKE